MDLKLKLSVGKTGEIWGYISDNCVVPLFKFEKGIGRF